MLIVGLAGGFLTSRRDRHAFSFGAISQRVARHYGELRPHLVKVIPTKTDNSMADMYLITLTGYFREGSAAARYLTFSALADGTYVWGIGATNDRQPRDGWDATTRWVWTDSDLPQNGR